MAQVGLVVLLVVVAAFMFMRMSGGGEEEESESAAPTEASVSVEGTGQTGTATGATPAETVEGAVENALEATPSAAGATGAVPTPPLPVPVKAAYMSDDTVVLLFVHDGGIDDKMVETATGVIEGDPSTSLFVVPARKVARYGAVTVGLEVNRVPALVVIRPQHLNGNDPQATVDYGYQTPEGVRQAVRDASYEGRELPYHPR
jgi:hypothetical protein